MNVIEKIKALPAPLKVVCWLQLFLAVVSLLSIVYSITASDGKEDISSLFNIVIPILAVMGIIQASKLIRMLVLIFSILGVIGDIYLMFLIASTKTPEGMMLLFPLVIASLIACITIWGLTHRKSKDYFGV